MNKREFAKLKKWTDTLTDEHNLKIKVVIYRAGSMPPKFLEK